jgi:5-methylthioadenosine/S-adenosylhomocysteine deaminase
MQAYDRVIQNGTVLTMDDQNTVYKTGRVAITGDEIAFVGNADEMLFTAVHVIDAKGGLILPGLVNGHTHAAMSLFRGLADDLPLMDWLNHYIFPSESKMDAKFVHTGAMLACAEMILSGTTTFCDMYLFEEETASAATSAGMRCLLGEVLYDFPSPNYGPAERGLEYSKDLIEKYKKDPLVSVAVEPHAPYTCSPKLLRAANLLALEYRVPLIIHMAETEREVIEIRQKYGKAPFAHLASLDVLGPHVIADHCVWMDHAEIDVMAQSGARAIHNPESNMKLASGIAPIPALLKQGITVGLGTDGCASNNNLDMFSEMDSTAKLHKVNAMDPTVMDALTVLRMATIEGARALGLEQATGSLEKGKKADVIIVDVRKPHLTPLYNPYSHLVYAARGSDVSHSIINGRLVMENRNLVTLDVGKVMEEARRQAFKIKDRLA